MYTVCIRIKIILKKNVSITLSLKVYTMFKLQLLPWSKPSRFMKGSVRFPIVISLLKALLKDRDAKCWLNVEI